MKSKRADSRRFPAGMILNVHPFIQVMRRFIANVPVKGKWEEEKEIAEKAGLILYEMLKPRKAWGEGCPAGTRPEAKVYVEERIGKYLGREVKKTK